MTLATAFSAKRVLTAKTLRSRLLRETYWRPRIARVVHFYGTCHITACFRRGSNWKQEKRSHLNQHKDKGKTQQDKHKDTKTNANAKAERHRQRHSCRSCLWEDHTPPSFPCLPAAPAILLLSIRSTLSSWCPSLTMGFLGLLFAGLGCAVE